MKNPIRIRIEIEQPDTGMAYVNGEISQELLDLQAYGRDQVFLEEEVQSWLEVVVREFLVRTGRP